MNDSITNPRNLVVAGAFSCVYFVVVFAGGMLGIISPAMILVGSALGLVINGFVAMLYLAKVPCFGAFTLVGAVLGTAYVLTGHTWYIIIAMLVMGVVADVIAKSGNYRKPLVNAFAYAVFNLSMLALLGPVFYNPDEYFTYVAESMDSVEYAEAMRALFSPTVILGWGVLSFAISLASGVAGTRAVRQHFVRAGVV